MGVRRRTGSFILQVNPILCDGFGHCAELAPELIFRDIKDIKAERVAA